MIIGSKSIKKNFPDFPREPKDIDIIGEDNGIEYDVRVEYLKNPVLTDYVLNKYGYIPEFCPINELYTLKISHSLWSLDNGSWEKHIWDIQWLKEKGCFLIKDLFELLYQYWSEVHGVRKSSKLDMSASEFFDNFVGYPVEHDYLHELLIKNDFFNGQESPMYKKVLKDGAEVDVCENKFNSLSFNEKYNLVIEEVMVMAIERYGDIYYKSAFNRMLKKFILNHAPIWESIWIIENHKYILTNIPFNFIDFLNQEIESSKLIA